MTTTPINDKRIVRRLWVILCLYETLIISIVAGAGLNISLTGGGSLYLAAPLLLIACAEALRVPLSAMMTRVRLFKKLLTFIALIAIAVGSAEGLAVAFEAFLQNRVTEIMRVNHEVKRAQQAMDNTNNEHRRQEGEISALTAQVGELDRQVAALAHEIPPPPAGSNRVCTGRKGAKVTCNVDATAATTYATAMKSYNERLKVLTDQRATLQSKVDNARNRETTTPPELSNALVDAKEKFDEVAAQSPVWRLVAVVFNEDNSSVTQEQFNTVKKYVVGTLAITFATLSMIASIVAHSTLKSQHPSKLSRAIRAWLAARRKKLRRVEATVVTEIRDRVIYRYVPCDPVSGKAIG